MLSENIRGRLNVPLAADVFGAVSPFAGWPWQKIATAVSKAIFLNVKSIIYPALKPPTLVKSALSSYNPRLALHSNTPPTAWKMKLGSQTIR